MYRGEWKVGFGIAHSEDFETGIFDQKDEPDGLGKWEQSDSSYYVGEFKAGRKDGKGYHFSPFGGSSGVGVTYYEV